MRNLTTEEKAMLVHVIEQGVNTLQEIAEMRESLKEDVAALADNLDVKAAIVNKAIRVAYKRNMSEMKTSLSDVEDLLDAAGRKL
jgi:hypothetical protein